MQQRQLLADSYRSEASRRQAELPLLVTSEHAVRGVDFKGAATPPSPPQSRTRTASVGSGSRRRPRLRLFARAAAAGGLVSQLRVCTGPRKPHPPMHIG